jgi:hypothetical protein
MMTSYPSAANTGPQSSPADARGFNDEDNGKSSLAHGRDVPDAGDTSLGTDPG